jgi:peptidoglycan/LPS O-acetylase OafA/YrhL
LLSSLHKINLSGPFFHFTWIISGAVLSLYENKLTPFMRNINPHLFLALLALLFLCPIFPTIHHEGLVIIPFSCFILSVLLIKSLHAPALWKKVLLNPIIQWIGLSSYSIYLWQELFTRHPSWILTPIGILACSSASYYFIEKPCNRIGRRWLSKHSSTKKLVDTLQKKRI